MMMMGKTSVTRDRRKEKAAADDDDDGSEEESGEWAEGGRGGE